MVSIAWDDQTHAEPIDPGGNRMPLTATPAWKIMDMTLNYTAHAMVLAAHDDQQKRWGFINSWVDGASVDHLYWMTDEDFGEM